MLELLIDQPLFIGFKADNTLLRRLEGLSASDKQYVSTEDAALLRICRVGEDTYVGKLCDELTTDRVDDIRLNVLSIIRKLGHEMRLPVHLKILACSEMKADSLLSASQLGSYRAGSTPFVRSQQATAGLSSPTMLSTNGGQPS